MQRDSSKNTAAYRDLNPPDVKKMLEDKKTIRLIDVREDWEYRIAHIENAELMPMSNFIKHVEKLNEDDELIVYCHTGIRSANVCRFLADKGFKNLVNLRGGIEAWSNEIDQSVPRY